MYIAHLVIWPNSAVLTLFTEINYTCNWRWKERSSFNFKSVAKYPVCNQIASSQAESLLHTNTPIISWISSYPLPILMFTDYHHIWETSTLTLPNRLQASSFLITMYPPLPKYLKQESMCRKEWKSVKEKESFLLDWLWLPWTKIPGIMSLFELYYFHSSHLFIAGPPPYSNPTTNWITPYLKAA